LHYFAYYGDNFKIECPTGLGKLMNLFEVAGETANRLTRIFLLDEDDRRPVFGRAEKFQKDPTGATICCSTNISTATTAPASAPAIRPAGPASSHF
jgi:hypothetical protein